MANFLKGFGDDMIAKNIGTKAGEVVEETVHKFMGGKEEEQNKEQQGGNKEKAAAGEDKKAAGEGDKKAEGKEGSEGNEGGHGLDLGKLAGGLFK